MFLVYSVVVSMCGLRLLLSSSLFLALFAVSLLLWSLAGSVSVRLVLSGYLVGSLLLALSGLFPLLTLSGWFFVVGCV